MPEQTPPAKDPAPLPAQARHLRLCGVLPCCQRAVQETTRATVEGDELGCPVCHAVFRVAPDGTWKWEALATAEALRQASTTGYNLPRSA